MRRLAPYLIAAALALPPVVAVAQRALTLQPATQVNKIELEPLADGGVRLTVYARTTETADGGARIDEPVSCDVSTLTTAQKSCLATIRAGALACWNSQEGL